MPNQFELARMYAGGFQDVPDDPEPNIFHERRSERLGFTIIPNYVTHASNLSVPAKFLYGLLKTWSWQEGSCFPNYETLCEEMGMTSNVVRKYMEELISKGLVEKIRQGQGKPNLYVLKDLEGAKLQHYERYQERLDREPPVRRAKAKK